MEKTVSIIVPVYNAEKTLERCVRSLMAQTLRSIEILLVNDGSPDRSPEICRQLASGDGRIRVIDKPNGGVSSARNAGLDAARGEFIMFCDSDDWVEPDWCESMLAIYSPGDMVICEIDRGGMKTGHTVLQRDSERRDILHEPLLASSPVNKLFDASVIKPHGLHFREGLSVGEDLCFVLEYLCKICGKLRFLYRELYHYDLSTAGSLSKCVPSSEQIDTLFRLMTESMLTLGAIDSQSKDNRDNGHVNWHFERLLEETAKRTDLSLVGKFAIADQINHLESFRTCCASFRQDRNPVFLWCYRSGRAGLVLLYLILKNQKEKLRQVHG